MLWDKFKKTVQLIGFDITGWQEKTDSEKGFILEVHVIIIYVQGGSYEGEEQSHT